MEQRYLILIDEQSQDNRLKRIKTFLKNDGIELIYKEINPQEITKRDKIGDLNFSRENFKRKLERIPFIQRLDVFATDYNLIDGQLDGMDVVEIFSQCLPNYRKRFIIYSAKWIKLLKIS